MDLLLQTTLFTLFLTLTVIIPGTAAIKLLKIKPSNNFAQIAITSALGIIVYTTSLVVFRLAALNFHTIIVIFTAFSSAYLFKKRKVIKNKFKTLKITTETSVFAALALIFALLQGNQLFGSGIFQSGNLHFNTGPHDPMQHFSIVAMLENGFPPKNPFYSGVDLKNYHYFSDHIMASFISTFPSDIFNLYFRIYPIFVSLLFSISAYAISKELINKVALRFLSMLLLTMGGSASYLIPLFQQNAQRWSSISFFVDQPYSQIFNLQNYIGYSLFLTGGLLLVTNEKTKAIGNLIATALSLGFAFPFKVFAATIGALALMCASAYKVIISREIRFLIPAAVISLLFLIFTVATVSSYRNGLYFAPGWGLTVMIDSADRLNLSDWSNRIEYYKSINNQLGLFKYYLYQVLIFTLGNLNIRIVGFIFLIFLFLKSPFKQKASNIFFLSVSVSSILIPMLFNLGSSPYDIFQFTHYSLMVSALFTAVALDVLFTKFKTNKWITVVCILLVTAAALPTTIKEIEYTFREKQNVVSSSYIEAINFIKYNSQQDDFLLIYPDDLVSSIAYFPALTKRAAFITDMGSINITGNNPQIRKQQALEFFNLDSDQKRDDFLKSNQISFVIAPPAIVQQLKIAKKPLNYNQVFENESFTIFKIN